jgi:hypothetical protein
MYSVSLPVTIYYNQNNDLAIKWCREQFGEPGFLDGHWIALDYTFQFKKLEHRDWFILRWGHEL